MEEKIAVSACLLGVNCKYNATNNFNEKLFNLLKDKRVFVICPEVFSSMPTPRIPSEILNGKVINKLGDDVTIYFMDGREKTLKFLKDSGVGNDCVIGARALLNKKFIESNVVLVGIPAKIVKRKINWLVETPYMIERGIFTNSPINKGVKK